MVLDDTNARIDWNWKPDFDIDKLCRIMLAKILKSTKSVHVDTDRLKRDVENDSLVYDSD